MVPASIIVSTFASLVLAGLSLCGDEPFPAVLAFAWLALNCAALLAIAGLS